MTSYFHATSLLLYSIHVLSCGRSFGSGTTHRIVYTCECPYEFKRMRYSFTFILHVYIHLYAQYLQNYVSFACNLIRLLRCPRFSVFCKIYLAYCWLYSIDCKSLHQKRCENIIRTLSTGISRLSLSNKLVIKLTF